MFLLLSLNSRSQDSIPCVVKWEDTCVYRTEVDGVPIFTKDESWYWCYAWRIGDKYFTTDWEPFKRCAIVRRFKKVVMYRTYNVKFIDNGKKD